MKDAVERTIEQYTPKVVDAEVWEAISEGVMGVVRDMGHSDPDKARADLTILTTYSDKLLRRGAWNPQARPSPPLGHDQVEFVVKNDLGDLTAKSRARYRQRLTAMGRRHSPDAWPLPAEPHYSKVAAPPYSQRELQQLTRNARHRLDLKGDPRPFMAIALGAGAGLQAKDCRFTYAADVHEVEGIVVVDFRGPDERRVPIRHDWAGVALDLAERLDGQLVLGGNNPKSTSLYSGMAARFNRDIQVKLTAVRLRNTWLVTLLEDNVHLRTIAAASGSREMNTLKLLLPWTRTRPAEEAYRELRGGSQ